jgi:hypothetical protein
VERWRPPTISRDGLPADDRAGMRALARAALAEVVNAAEPPPRDTPDFAERLAAWRQLRAVIADAPHAARDGAWRLARSLVVPQPHAVVADGWAEVPAVAHWLGADDALAAHTPPAFAIAVQVVARDGAPWRCTADEALAWCAAHGCRPPTPAAWKCARRGVDARRHAWDAGIDAHGALTAGAWGVGTHALDVEWARDEDGRWWCCGGTGVVPCWQRAPAGTGARALLRRLR